MTGGGADQMTWETLQKNGVLFVLLIGAAWFLWKEVWPFLKNNMDRAVTVLIQHSDDIKKLSAERDSQFLIALERRDKALDGIMSEFQKQTADRDLRHAELMVDVKRIAGTYSDRKKRSK